MPSLVRHMSADVTAMGAASAKLAASLPDAMKPIAAEGVRAHSVHADIFHPHATPPPLLPPHTQPSSPPPSRHPAPSLTCMPPAPSLALPALHASSPPRSRVQPAIAEEVAAIYAAQPALMAAVEAKIAEADKPGVRATVAAAKSPGACKYTEEGSIVDSMLKQVAQAERRMEALASLEYTLTASDKEELLKAYAAKAVEQGADVKFTAAMAPDKLTLG